MTRNEIKLAFALPAVLVPLIVIEFELAEPAVVPEITPVVVLREIPAGRVPEVKEYVNVVAVTVVGVIEIAVFTG